MSTDLKTPATFQPQPDFDCHSEHRSSFVRLAQYYLLPWTRDGSRGAWGFVIVTLTSIIPALAVALLVQPSLIIPDRRCAFPSHA